jgi:hypothetical protein
MMIAGNCYFGQFDRAGWQKSPLTEIENISVCAAYNCARPASSILTFDIQLPSPFFLTLNHPFDNHLPQVAVAPGGALLGFSGLWAAPRRNYPFTSVKGKLPVQIR